jgi:hypothetical protein
LFLAALYFVLAFAVALASGAFPVPLDTRVLHMALQGEKKWLQSLKTN